MSASLVSDPAPSLELEEVVPEGLIDDSVGSVLSSTFVVLLFSFFYCCIPLFPPLGILPIFGGRSSSAVIGRIIVSIPAVWIALAVLCASPLLLLAGFRSAAAGAIGWFAEFYMTPA